MGVGGPAVALKFRIRLLVQNDLLADWFLGGGHWLRKHFEHAVTLALFIRKNV